MNKQDLRQARIMAEITDLQNRLINNGYKLGETINPNENIPEEHKEWIGRIWLLGYALTKPWVMPGL